MIVIVDDDEIDQRIHWRDCIAISPMNALINFIIALLTLLDRAYTLYAVSSTPESFMPFTMLVIGKFATIDTYPANGAAFCNETKCVGVPGLPFNFNENGNMIITSCENTIYMAFQPFNANELSLIGT